MSVKSHRKFSLFYGVFLGFFISISLFAEEVRIVFKNGNVTTGEFLSQTSKDIKLRKASGNIVTIPSSRIRLIESAGEMVLIPAGEFLMGSREYIGEKPIHKIYLDSFYIDRYEVTNAQYKACLAYGSCQLPPHLPPGDRVYFEDPRYAKYPVVYIDWFQAKRYCQWKAKRLPTEAEWEKSARGIEGQKYPWGDDWCETCLNWGEEGKKDGYVGPAPVGSFEKDRSPYGVYDMAGNVLEWVNDWYDEDYYKKSPYKNPQGPNSGKKRVLRGGSWWRNGTPWGTGTPRRHAELPHSSFIIFGFRCAASR